MIEASPCMKQYSSAKQRFFRPVIINFFANEFPKLFGPIMREKLADELITLFENVSPEIKRLKPGQILWNALDKHTRGDSPNRRFVPVILNLITEKDVDELANGIPISKITEKSISRMICEAYEQGGILSNRDISLLTLRSTSETSRRRIKYEKENNCVLPHTGAIHDMGTTISHKKTIVQKVVFEKKDPADVARECNHTQRAVDNYLKDYNRVKTAYDYNKDLSFIHNVTGIAKYVVKQYVEMINHG
ncbi:DUF1670 domain-containing protein [Candidatus Dependentiae bacterium]|nr:DUF1670 domain-containing protein [Candidatus Dependentiae bacterium]MCG2716365.1 DUF1670 domain-containing protein [Candidatus Neomarinimicrobiota bacterium]